MITLFNAPEIVSCIGFGLLSDKLGVSTSINTFVSATGAALCTFLLWGLASDRVPAVLVCFSLFFGFFAGGYSSTWGGWIKELEKEAIERNEAINTGVLYGLLNGARGVGYVGSGFAGVELSKVGAVKAGGGWGFSTGHGGLILFTGLTCVFGGWSIARRVIGRGGRCRNRR